jgi:hypothetical protein
LFSLSIVLFISLAFKSFSQKENSIKNNVSNTPRDSTATSDSVITIFEPIPFDSALIDPFFKSYPKLKKYKKELIVIYQDHSFNYIWFDQKRVVVYGSTRMSFLLFS